MRSISYARRSDMDVIESKYAARLAEAARMPLALLGTFCLQTGSPLEIGIGRSPAGQEYDQARQTQLILKVISDHYHTRSPFEQKQCTDLAIPAASESAVFWIEKGDTLVAVRHLTSTRILFSAIIRSATQRVFQKWQRDMLRLVIDRICARTLSAAGESFAAAAQVLTAVLDTLTVGIAIVEQSERCTYLNTAARTFVEEARLARIFHDRLVWRNVCMDRRYREAIRTATADTQRSASAFVLPPDEDRDNMTALLRKGWMKDSSRESSVVAALHEQTDPTELQDRELANLQRSAEAAWLPNDLVRSGHGLGAAADRQARPAAAI